MSGSPSLVDWDLAARTARRLVRSGPEVTADVAAQAVEQLLQLSDEAESHVRRLTKLTPQTSTVPAVRVGGSGRGPVINRPARCERIVSANCGLPANSGRH